MAAASAYSYYRDDAPLMSLPGLVGMAGLYLTVKFGGEAIMRDRKPFDTKFPAMVSNALLAVGSLWMFAGFCYHLFNNWSAAGWDMSLLVCDPELKLQQGMDLFLYVFYLSKFWEYVDTIFLILGKREVIFLHWFHHFITPSICWAAFSYPGACSWAGPLTNAGVHVVMYSYYTATYFGVSRWVGKYITKIQIVQFIGNIALFNAIFLNLAVGQGYDTCKGNLYQYAFVYANYINFLVLFVQFNRRRLQKLAAAKKAEKERQSAQEGAAPAVEKKKL